MFYGRRSITNTGSVWAINLDGTDDTYITQGVRPRASRDGLWIAFQREGNPFNSQGNLWVRNMQTGVEQRLLDNINGDTIVCYDWEPDDSGLVLDFNCGLWRLSLNGTFTQLITNCFQAPALNPQNEQIACQDFYNQPVPGLSVTLEDGTPAQLIVSNVTGASWPAWSPDSKLISFADSNSVTSLDSGVDLWLVNTNGTSLNRICNFAGTGNHFQHGAIWTPDSMSLVGAGTIDTTNGIWIVPLNADRTDCGGLPILLPTTPGDALDFAGSVVIGNNAPVIISQPQSTIVALGQPASVTVLAVGGLPLHYEWIKDGVILPNQTNNTLSFPSFQFTDTGLYQVVVTNAWGMALSLPARVALTNAPLRVWGDNFSGQLGLGYVDSGDTQPNFGEPLLLTSNVVAATAGGDHSLYLTAGGQLWGMGSNVFGQLGTGSTNGTDVPILIATNVVTMSAGSFYTLYVTGDGTLWGMGYNVSGQLGNGSMYGMGYIEVGVNPTNNVYSPQPLASNVVAISAGDDVSEYITGDGNLWTMGYTGLLGDGSIYGSNVPVMVASDVVCASAGLEATYFITADGALWGEGSAYQDLLGRPENPFVTPFGNYYSPIEIATNVVAAAAGGYFALYVTADGILWGMGDVPEATDADGTGVPFEGLTDGYIWAITNNVAQISAGVDYSLYVTTDGHLWGIGDNGYGELGSSGLSYNAPPTPANAGNLIVASLARGVGAQSGLAVAAAVPFYGAYENQTISVGQSFFVGSYLALSFPGDSPIGYQWQFNGVNIPGATNSGYEVAGATPSNAGVYTIEIVGPYSSYSYGSAASVTISIDTPSTAPVITQPPVGASVGLGQAASLSVSATGAGVPVSNALSYQWIKDGGLLPSQTGASISFPSFQLTNSGAYQVVVSNALGLAISMPAFLSLSNSPLRGWGYNQYGELGDGGSYYGVASPELVASNAVTAAAGAYHSLYVTPDHTLWGMGYDYDGELGDGNSGVQYYPEALTNNVLAVAAGEYFSLFVTADGTLWGMGQNYSDQLGDDVGSYVLQPVEVDTNVVAVAAGGSHTLYLTADGVLWGLGNNSDGELGDGTYNDISAPEMLATNVVTIAAGEKCSFFVTADGVLWAMGDNSEGELGDGGSELNTNQPEDIATNVVAVATGGYPTSLGVGGYHSMYVTADSNLWVMGYNGEGELGDGGSELSTNVPESVAPNVVAVSAGAAQSYFIKGDGTLWATGDNESGELGIGYANSGSSTPVQVNSGGLVAASLARGEAALHALVVAGEAPEAYIPYEVATNGLPFTFDAIVYRGDGPFTYQWQFLYENISGATNSSYTVSDAVSSYVDEYVYDVIVTGPYGTGYAYGVYFYPAPPVVDSLYSYPGAGPLQPGQFAYLYASYSSLLPVTIQWLKDGAILPGQTGNILYFYSFGLTNTGAYQAVVANSAGMIITPPSLMASTNAALEVWGANNDGQLGDGTSNNAPLPEMAASNAVFAAAGAEHSLYVTVDGSLWAMGGNSTGQLGDGGTTNSSQATNIAGSVVAAAAGGGHSLFIMSDGSLWGMGADAAGQLGDGTNGTELLPEELQANVVAVAAGQDHSLYLDGTGPLWAMGQNTSGQLGLGTTNNAMTPQSVASNVITIAAGGRHSLYLTVDSNLWGMGLNSSGQLGNGATNSVSYPIWVASNVLALAAGDAHSLYVTADGKLWATGQNDYGQLGNGTTNNANMPLMIATNVIAVSAGANHSLYITGDGRIWAMGQNSSDQLGNGTQNGSDRPVPVASGGLIAANVAKGPEASHALAVAETGPTLTPPVILAVTVQPNSGGPGRIITLTVNPIQNYNVLVSTDLINWTSLGNFSPNVLGQLIVTDPGAVTSARFYELQR